MVMVMRARIRWRQNKIINAVCCRDSSLSNMIRLLIPLAAGEAVKVMLNPPSNALSWRVLRNTTGDFTDASSAVEVIYEGGESVFIDTAGVSNAVSYFYKPVYFDGKVWDDQFLAKQVTVANSFTDVSIDPLLCVRDRLDLGLNAMLHAGKLTHPSNAVIPVLLSSPQFEDAQFPLVTLHVEHNQVDNFGLGYALADDVDEFGWYTQSQLSITCWSLNGDERNLFRKAVKAVLLANFEVFDFAGLLQIDVQQSDREEFTLYPWPTYMSETRFSCLSLTALVMTQSPLLEIITVTNVNDEITR